MRRTLATFLVTCCLVGLTFAQSPSQADSQTQSCGEVVEPATQISQHRGRVLEGSG